MCPGDLLGIVASLVADGGPSEVERLVSVFGNVEHAFLTSLGTFPWGAGRPCGTGCWGCGMWHCPAGAVCPACGCAGGLDIPGLSAEQQDWVQGFDDVLGRYPGLADLRAVGGALMYAYFCCLHVWLGHLQQRAHRWTSAYVPSAPPLGCT